MLMESTCQIMITNNIKESGKESDVSTTNFKIPQASFQTIFGLFLKTS